MLRWGKDNPRSLAEVALLACWPEDRNESNEAVIRQTRAGLRSIGIGGTPTLAAFAIAQVDTFASDRNWMQMLRETPSPAPERPSGSTPDATRTNQRNSRSATPAYRDPSDPQA